MFDALLGPMEEHVPCSRCSKGRRGAHARSAPPCEGWVKINFDGTTFTSCVEGGRGVVARSSSRACLGWAFCWLQESVSAEQIDAIAAREVVCLAACSRCRAVIMEGDYASLLLKMQSIDVDLSIIGPTVGHIKMSGSSFSHFFSFVCYTGNRVSHVIARSTRAFTVGSFVAPNSIVEVCISI
ncbi:hypothetical protein Salat_1688600 [Sesamum alatum]|uniref:RNase H type-1 domain-containing protein n=1 Tax=Sesamum alatum TaxID=300844 RepID=A0AAE1Y7E3_9LAMI|nr:hypothetical protein Salat_1688600 [Sesamum alatum]